MDVELGLVPLECHAMTLGSASGHHNRVPNWVRTVLVLCVGLGAVALFLLATAAANTTLFAAHYALLLALNGGIAFTLTVLVAYQLFMLRRKLRSRVFGSKLTLRLVLLFMLMAVLPGALVYGVSVQFLAKSIESWFEVRLDKALEGGLNMGRNTLDNMLKELTSKADSMALALSVRAPAEHLAALNTLREQAGVQEATLFGPRGKIIAFSGNERTGIMPDPPSSEALRKLRLQQVYAAIESIPDRGLYLRVLAPVNMVSLAEETRVLQLMQPVPRQLSEDAEIVQTGYREYQELLLARRGLKQLYGITLTLALLIALLAALAAAFLISDRLSSPLSVLVEGTRAVAQGDFTRRAAVESSDELGVLTRSFNAMTVQLADARGAAERNQAELAHAKAYLESILANLSAGVLAFDDALRLKSANPSAAHILAIDCAPLINQPLDAWAQQVRSLGVLAHAIAEGFSSKAGEWAQQVEREAAGGMQVLLLRGTRLAEHSDSGYIVVFDDITHLLQAQRDAAWAEVARRLAHEIKNPLTPIQLSAERMQVKLAPKLSEPDSEMLARSTETIVNQVSALKHLVDAFSQYARTPEPSMRALDLNALVREVLRLYDSLAPNIRLDLARELPPIVGDAAQLRQVIHNLLQNAQDALAGAAAPRIVISSELAGAGRVRFSVTDNGSGFADNLMKRVFEPYVTTKPRGTGLGLVIVKKIVEEHGGQITISNVKPRGACVSIVLPVAASHGAQSKSAA
jgi:two-component system, NtrC family, nitrogen regulation sensor histidine kinase NtrY